MPRKTSGPQRYKNVSTDIGDRTYSGSFHVEDGHVHVGGAYGAKSAPLSGSSPVDLASRLLREILAEKRSKRALPPGRPGSR